MLHPVCTTNYWHSNTLFMCVYLVFRTHLKTTVFNSFNSIHFIFMTRTNALHLLVHRRRRSGSFNKLILKTVKSVFFIVLKSINQYVFQVLCTRNKYNMNLALEFENKTNKYFLRKRILPELFRWVRPRLKLLIQ